MRSIILAKTLSVICVMAMSNLGCQKDKSLKADLNKTPKAAEQQGQQPAAPAQTQSTNKSDTQATPAVVSAPIGSDSVVTAKPQVEPITAADKEKADKEKADKEKADKEKADKEKADKEKADKEKADKEKADKEKADKVKADKVKADKEKADKEKADKEKADKVKADKVKADKEKADKVKAAKEEKIKSTKVETAKAINQLSDIAVNAKNCDESIQAIETKIDGQQRIFVISSRFTKSIKQNKDGSPSVDLIEFDKQKKKFNVSFSNATTSTNEKIDLNDSVLELQNGQILISKKSNPTEKIKTTLRAYQIRNTCPKIKAHDLLWIASSSDLVIDNKLPKFKLNLTVHAKDQNNAEFLIAFQFNNDKTDVFYLTKDANNKLLLLKKNTFAMKLSGDSIDIQDNGVITYSNGQFILTSTQVIPGNGVLRSQTKTQAIEMTPLYLPEIIKK